MGSDICERQKVKLQQDSAPANIEECNRLLIEGRREVLIKSVTGYDERWAVHFQRRDYVVALPTL